MVHNGMAYKTGEEDLRLLHLSFMTHTDGKKMGTFSPATNQVEINE